MTTFGNFTTLHLADIAAKARGACEFFCSPKGEIFVKNPNSPGGLIFRKGERPQYWDETPDGFYKWDPSEALFMLRNGLQAIPVYRDDEGGVFFNPPGAVLATREDVLNVPCDVASIWEALSPGDVLALADGVFQVDEAGVLEEI